MTSPGLVSYQSVTTKRLLFSDPDLLKFDASDFVFRDSNIFSRVVVPSFEVDKIWNDFGSPKLSRMVRSADNFKSVLSSSNTRVFYTCVLECIFECVFEQQWEVNWATLDHFPRISRRICSCRILSSWIHLQKIFLFYLSFYSIYLSILSIFLFYLFYIFIYSIFLFCLSILSFYCGCIQCDLHL